MHAIYNNDNLIMFEVMVCDEKGGNCNYASRKRFVCAQRNIMIHDLFYSFIYSFFNSYKKKIIQFDVFVLIYEKY